jgi:hypothetical protein
MPPGKAELDGKKDQRHPGMLCRMLRSEALVRISYLHWGLTVAKIVVARVKQDGSWVHSFENPRIEMGASRQGAPAKAEIPNGQIRKVPIQRVPKPD